MRKILALVFLAALCGLHARAGEDEASITVEKQGGEDVLRIKGRIKSRHVSYRKGKSVRSYYIVTPELIKIPLPRSHVEHRDGTISGIYLRKWRGKEVEIVCEGRVKDDPKEGKVVTVEKIIKLLTTNGG